MFEDLVNAGVDLWNMFLEWTWSILSKTPQQISPDTWTFVKDSIFPFFAIIGNSLVIIFFMYGWIQNEYRYKNEMEVKDMVLVILRLCGTLAIFNLVLNIIPQVLSGCAKLVTKVQGMTSYGVGKLDTASLLNDMPDTSSPFSETGLFVLGLIFGLIVLIMAGVCGFKVLYASIGRLFKIYILFPIGAVSLSTLASDGSSRSAFNWIKEFLLTASEVVVIAMVLIVGNIFISSGFLNNALNLGNATDTLKLLGGALSLILSFGIVAGAVSSAEKLLRQSF